MARDTYFMLPQQEGPRRADGALDTREFTRRSTTVNHITRRRGHRNHQWVTNHWLSNSPATGIDQEVDKYKKLDSKTSTRNKLLSVPVIIHSAHHDMINTLVASSTETHVQKFTNKLIAVDYSLYYQVYSG